MSESAPDATGARILVAAGQVLADFGYKRATVELVAKYAGVSHMTVYRRWSSRNELLATALLSELSAVLDAAFDSVEVASSFREQLASAFAELVWSVQRHPLVVRELSTDRDASSPVMTASSRMVMESTVPLVVARLQRLEAAGELSSDDADAIADVFVRLAHSLVLLERTDRPLTDKSDIEAYAHRSLAPLAELAEFAAVPDADEQLFSAPELVTTIPSPVSGFRIRAAAGLSHPRFHLAAASLVIAVIAAATLMHPVRREISPTDHVTIPSPSVTPSKVMPVAVPPAFVSSTQSVVVTHTITPPEVTWTAPPQTDEPRPTSSTSTADTPSFGDSSQPDGPNGSEGPDFGPPPPNGPPPGLGSSPGGPPPSGPGRGPQPAGPPHNTGPGSPPGSSRGPGHPHSGPSGS